MVQPLWIASIVTMLAGIGYTLLTHFTGIPGGLIFGPIILGLGIGLGEIQGGVKNPIIVVATIGGISILGIGINLYNWFGLSGFI